MPVASIRKTSALRYMRVYIVPPDMNEKEKVIGGILNLNQFFWLLGGVGFGASMFFLTMKSLGTVFATVIALLCAGGGVPFAVYKKKGLTLFQLIKLKRSYKKKVKKLPNLRKPTNLDKYIENTYLR